MRRCLVVGALFALCLPGATDAGTRVIGGTAVDVRSAPWTVLVKIPALASTATGYCSGTIIDATHIVTAAHCVDLGPNGHVDPTTITVQAGISDALAPLSTDVPQSRVAVAYRVHPGFHWSRTGSADDVAVLDLGEPLDLSGPAARAVVLTAATVRPGAVVRSVGFGRQSFVLPRDVTLNGMSVTVGMCGNVDSAVYRCATSNRSAMCAGDSGSAFVVPGPTPALVGIATAATCTPGTPNWFGDVDAPEILFFIQGNDAPPMAPRSTSAPVLRYESPPRAATRVVCLPGRWSGTPTFRYEFLNERGRVLQASQTSWYKLRPTDVSHRVRCRLSAANTGGTAVLATAASPPVRK